MAEEIVCAQVTVEVRERIDEQAALDGMSRSAAIKEMILRALDGKNPRSSAWTEGYNDGLRRGMSEFYKAMKDAADQLWEQE